MFSAVLPFFSIVTLYKNADLIFCFFIYPVAVWIIITEEINIKTQLDSDDSLTKVTGSSSNITYIGGTNPNNYIWYSGKLWRVVSYNSSTDVVKAVTANPITSIYYNSNKESSFNNSDVEIWLNNQFLSSLKDQQQFLVSYNWNYTANSDMSLDSNNSASNKKLKVGLITTYEYGKIKGNFVLL